jgi:hypothetical protein
VFAHVVEEPDNVVVIEGVEREAACAPDADESGRAQKTQLMRHSRLRDPHQ